MEAQKHSVLTPGAFNPLTEELSNYLRNHPVHNCEDTNKRQKCSGVYIDGEDLCLLSLPPRFTTIRVNLLQKTLNEAKVIVEDEMRRQYEEHICIPSVYPHHTLPDLLIVESDCMQHVVPANKEVVIGKMCGSAVLRGAEVYAPGVVGVLPGLAVGEYVAVYVDLDGKCLRGSKKYEGRKMFVGNGILMQTRKELFTKEKPSGIAVSMKEPIFYTPSLGTFNQNFLFLQNLPSILCSHVLGASEHAVVLDMCAAPGGKSTHIASLMNGTGIVIAIDRSQKKVDQINVNAHRLGLKNIRSVKYDSTLLVEEKLKKADATPLSIKETVSINKQDINSFEVQENISSLLPPYKPSSFKWILLDAPCSALGQRPQLHTKTSVKEVESFPVIQRKLLNNAVKLLEPGGTLVYSTCTIICEENEKMVKWVLDKHTDIVLTDSQPKLGMPGLPNCGLNEEQCNKVQRFGPSCMISSVKNAVDRDTIGFFIASFSKSGS